jgi:acyl carrier protein
MNDINQELMMSIKQAIAEVLEVPLEKVTEESEFTKDFPDVDSIKVLELLAMLEQKFKISIDEDKLISFTTTSNVYEIVNGILNKVV